MSKRTFSIPSLRIPLHDAWRRSRSAAACLLTGAALTATCIAAAPSAWAEATVPEGATGVWSFEGSEPFKGTGSQSFSIEEVEDPNDSVKVEDSGIPEALGRALASQAKTRTTIFEFELRLTSRRISLFRSGSAMIRTLSQHRASVPFCCTLLGSRLRFSPSGKTAHSRLLLIKTGATSPSVKILAALLGSMLSL